MIGLKEPTLRSAKLRLESLKLFRHHTSIKTEPKTNALVKISILGRAFLEVMQNGFEENEVTEIPVYDTARYGKIIDFEQPEGFDVVKQTWISNPSAMITILNNRQTNKNIYSYYSRFGMLGYIDEAYRSFKRSETV